MDYEILLFAFAFALIPLIPAVIIELLNKKKCGKCDKCAHRTKKGCRIVHWEKIENLNLNGRCGFYKEKGEQNNLVEQLTAFAQHLNKRGAFREDLCMDLEHEAQSFMEFREYQNNKEL